MTTAIEKLKRSYRHNVPFRTYYFMKDGTVFTENLHLNMRVEYIDEKIVENNDYIVRLLGPRLRRKDRRSARKILIHNPVFDKWYCTKDSSDSSIKWNSLNSYSIYEMTSKEETLLALTAVPA